MAKTISRQQQQQPSAEKIVTEMLHCQDPESLMDFYQTWSDKYDDDLKSMNMSNSLLQLTKKVAEHLPDKNCRIIDICAGTGLSGEALQRVGFTNIDAIDGSQGMLDKARTKNVYKQLFHELIGCDRIKSLPDCSYDASFASGTFAPGHLGAKHLRPVLATIKPGGIFCTGVRHRYLSSDHHREMEAEMLRMEQAGLWRRVALDELENHVSGQPAKVFIYRKL